MKFKISSNKKYVQKLLWIEHKLLKLFELYKCQVHLSRQEIIAKAKAFICSLFIVQKCSLIGVKLQVCHHAWCSHRRSICRLYICANVLTFAAFTTRSWRSPTRQFAIPLTCACITTCRARHNSRTSMTYYTLQFFSTWANNLSIWIIQITTC